jgi:hypothetical protein
MKLLFYSLNNLKSYSNVNININILKPENIIITSDLKHDGYMNGYYSLCHSNNLTKLYYRASKSIYLNDTCFSSNCNKWNSYTCIATTTNGINFNKNNNNIVLDGKCSSHNFTALYDFNDNKYKGIGGLHADYKIHNNCKKEHKFFKYKGQQILSSYYNDKCKANGLYLYESLDGIDWNLIYNKPIISGIHKGQTDNRKGWGWSEFDGAISFLQYNNYYYIYCRANIINKRRFIQYTKSIDLINWDDFKLIDMKYNINTENFYYPGVFKYPDTNLLFCISPYTNINNTYGSLQLMISNNGSKWENIGSILNTLNIKLRNDKHIVTGIYTDISEYYLYIQNNYGGLNINESITNIQRYSFKKDKLFYIESNNNLIGQIVLNKIHIINNIFINYECSDNGYIYFIINNIKYYIKDNYILFNKPIFNDITIILYKTKLFSITYI